ncbi:glycosyltransferase [Cryobacterium sp. 1639]|uniref:glycosyltransferase n=1 Tax=Cryobacterium inferilacus TaxID=2866629 RepID=UPI001C73257D|nr:glycosyltransferase [Cryobacterium sp. 1639]MBX0300978.1 glycosyltransferase [Cryobacterium sp. 1639]
MSDNLRSLWNTKGTFQLLVLSEFSLKYAVGTWLISRLRGATHMVDGFVGMYESEIEDRKNASPRTLAALLYKLGDRLALLTADIYLIDTDVRRDRLKGHARRGTSMITLPVGAPAWARPTTTRDPGGDIRVLYYGNYIPLHGVEYAVEAVAGMPADSRVRMTLVGDISRAPDLRSRISEGSPSDRFRVVGEVPEQELAEIIARHDVVLGIFGTSPKASSVIANKVWQGLASGKVVITRESAALREISELIGDQLILVEGASAAAIRRSIESVRIPEGAATNVAAQVLEEYTALRYHELTTELRKRHGEGLEAS